MTQLAHGLKEWQVTVDVLEQGETIVLLRKGGIRETGGKFWVEHEQVWLYPTFEHQQPDLLKPPYASKVKPVQSGWHPETVRIGSWATVTDVLPLSNTQRMAALLPFHIWNEAFVTERLKWKPNQPVYVLLLRVYRLESPQTIAYSSAYGGCKSWIDLVPLSLDGSQPVLDRVEYHDQVSQIRAAITG